MRPPRGHFARRSAAELFKDNFDAVGVRPADSKALATALARLAADAELRSQLGSSARLTAAQAFDRARLGPRACELYDRLLRRQAA